MLSRSSTGNSIANELSKENEPPFKKRRLDEEPHTNGSITGPGALVFEARDISFSLPQRKKLHLGLVLQPAQEGGKSAVYSIQLRNPATNQVDATFPLSSYSTCLRLPVPEKNQKQYNFCLIPSANQLGTEPVIWTVNHGPLKSYKIESEDLKAAAPGSDDVLENVLNFCLTDTGMSLVVPNEKEFASATRESHRKNDVAYHVKAFRGSKEGKSEICM